MRYSFLSRMIFGFLVVAGIASINAAEKRPLTFDDLTSSYYVTEELWFPEWEMGGTPYDNQELYDFLSPARYVRNFKTPQLVTHGEIDYRVPIGEGLAMFTALQRRGIESKLLSFPDEGHWILKPLNSELFYRTVIDWLNKYTRTP